MDGKLPDYFPGCEEQSFKKTKGLNYWLKTKQSKNNHCLKTPTRSTPKHSFLKTTLWMPALVNLHLTDNRKVFHVTQRQHYNLAVRPQLPWCRDVGQMEIIQGIQLQWQSQGALPQLAEIPNAYHKSKRNLITTWPWWPDLFLLEQERDIHRLTYS